MRSMRSMRGGFIFRNRGPYRDRDRDRDLAGGTSFPSGI
jgi:hypothetical protein